MSYRLSNLRRRFCVALAITVLLTAGFLIASQPANAESRAEVQELVDKAKRTVDNFKTDPDIPWFRDNVGRAKAVMVVPVLIKGGFIIGGSGGHGALLWRDGNSSSWSHPAFYFMGAVTFGLQIGGEAAEVVLLAMTEKGKQAFLSTEFKLGADASVAAGPVGAGAQAATADVLAFARSKGLFGGITVEGAVIEPRDEWNEAYYGRPVLPSDILVRRAVSNSGADGLRRSLGGTGAATTSSSTSSGSSSGGSATTSSGGGYNVATIQRALLSKAYDPGPADGAMGPRTRNAIRQYQADNGLPVTGQPSAELQSHLLGQ